MKQNKYEEAIEKYSEAIEVVPVATYFCNRAAAYSKVSLLTCFSEFMKYHRFHQCYLVYKFIH